MNNHFPDFRSMAFEAIVDGAIDGLMGFFTAMKQERQSKIKRVGFDGKARNTKKSYKKYKRVK